MAYKPEYGRKVGIVLPTELVRRLDQYIVKNDNYTSRSKIIAAAIAQFLDSLPEESR